jgi:SAM-dependent methyltransferase
MKPSVTAWFEDDAFWEFTFPFLSGEDTLAEAESQVAGLLKLIGGPRDRILDLCCGVGRHSIHLARKGAKVTGVDRSSFLLGKARAQAEAEGLSIEWLQDDMRTFVRPEAFDLVINLCTSFGYFEKTGEDIAVLQHVYRSLAPGGVFVLELRGKEVFARGFTPSSVEVAKDGTLWAQRREITDDWSRIRSHWVFIRDEHATHIRIDYILYSGRELADLLEKTGFEQVKLFGGLDGTPYDANAKRLAVVAVKPKA